MEDCASESGSPAGAEMKALHLLPRMAAGLLLITLIPLLIVCAILIVLEDGRPILFRQLRIGRLGKPFQILKLRTMTHATGARKITATGDSRITVAGRLMRRYKLDELPQLWNVFCGDMNFIGPRPEVPDYVDLSDGRWQQVLSVRPGITDLASLAFRNEELLLSQQCEVEEFYRNWLLPRKLDMSAHYMRNRCFVSDIRLLVLTVKHALAPQKYDPIHIAEEFEYKG